MKFLVEHCFKCKTMSRSKVSKVLELLINEGYTITSWEMVEDSRDWEYCGVNSHGSVMFYSDNHFYIDIDTKPFHNVLDEEWVDNYLLTS